MAGLDESPSISNPSGGNAVYVRSLSRRYGKFQVLKDLNLTLPCGAIYGLLGPSGCGKTTFLKILLGRLKIGSGTVAVFDRVPGSPDSGVPGRDVGFMPQELALYEEFTLEEHFRYYAKLNGMKDEGDEFTERVKWLTDFLDLPRDNRAVGTFSGGQQRRVSLAIALLHRPKLLLLDEPTVGVDPMLRTRIWNYLVDIAAQGCSIIITTHYIEEARQAHLVGFMRDGRILDEGNPEELMERYKQASLEDTFLHLCRKQDTSALDTIVEAKRAAAPLPIPRKLIINKAPSGDLSVPLISVAAQGDAQFNELQGGEPGCCGSFGPRRSKITGTLWKNFKRLVRNYPFLLFQFLLPSIQVSLFCLAIGKPPTNINLGVVQQDTTGEWGQNYVKYLNTGEFELTYYNTDAEADWQVRHGHAWGYVSVPANFSQDLFLRFITPDPSPDLVSGSTIMYYLDQSSEQISVFIMQRVTGAFASMIHDSPFGSKASLPVQMGTPVYGPKEAKFTDFIAPGMIVTISFSQSIGLTAIAFVMDKKTGNLDRAWAGGIRPSEIMLSQVFSQLMILVAQNALLLFFGLFIFKLPMMGSIPLAMLISAMLGMTGMMYGLVISSLCEEERQAITMALGSFFPALLLSGTLWPVEAIPVPLSWISRALPTTHAANAMRSIMSRGWGMDEQEVWLAFAVTGAWIVALFVLASRGLRRMK